jgi:hypothetical protein
MDTLCVRLVGMFEKLLKKLVYFGPDVYYLLKLPKHETLSGVMFFVPFRLLHQVQDKCVLLLERLEAA